MKSVAMVASIMIVSGCTTGMAERGHAPAKPKSAEVWQPGDDIPGWPDYDCPEPSGDDLEVGIAYPSTLNVTTGFTSEVPIGIGAVWPFLGDCLDAECSGADAGPRVDLRFSRVSGGDGRGQGSYTSSDPEAFRIGGYLENVLYGYWDTHETYGNYAVDVHLCLSRVRPDEIRGTMQVYQHDLWFDPWGRPYHLAYEFLAQFDDHGGDSEFGDPDCSNPSISGTTVDGTALYYYHDVLYDDAWPWAEITDPDIREAVYQRYYPCAG